MTFHGAHPAGDTCIDTFSGRTIDLASPDPADIYLDDIVTGLAQTCRFGGQSGRFYSVAEHSVLVHDLVRPLVLERDLDPDIITAAKYHDGHEGYLQDLTRPLKALLQPAYGVLTGAMDRAIAQRLDIDPGLFGHHLIRAADDFALGFEAAALMAPNAPGWEWARQTKHILPEGITWHGHLDPEAAKSWFYGRTAPGELAA